MTDTFLKKRSITIKYLKDLEANKGGDIALLEKLIQPLLKEPQRMVLAGYNIYMALDVKKNDTYLHGSKEIRTELHVGALFDGEVIVIVSNILLGHDGRQATSGMNGRIIVTAEHFLELATNHLVKRICRILTTQG